MTDPIAFWSGMATAFLLGLVVQVIVDICWLVRNLPRMTRAARQETETDD